MRVTVAVPLRAEPHRLCEVRDLAHFLTELAESVDEVLVCDGSDADTRPLVSQLLPHTVRVMNVETASDPAENPKARGVLTLLRASRGDLVLVMDDDVRFPNEVLTNVACVTRSSRLSVRTSCSNVLACVEVTRSLINLGVAGSDSATAFVLTREDVERILTSRYGRYLYDNLELEWTVAGIGKQLPTVPVATGHRAGPRFLTWCEQQIRYAYEDLPAVLKTLGFVAYGVSSVIGLVLCSELLILPLLMLNALVVAAWRGRRRLAPQLRPSQLHLMLVPVWVTVRCLALAPALCRLLTGGCHFGTTRVLRPSPLRWTAW